MDRRRIFAYSKGMSPLQVRITFDSMKKGPRSGALPSLHIHAQHPMDHPPFRTFIARSFLLPACAALLFFFSACQHDPVSPADQPRICFATQVLPIFQSNCAKSGCHDGGRESRTDLRSADGILRNVSPGHPLDSPAYAMMISVWGNMMPPPPSAPVSKEARQIVELWILQGADISCQGS
jgi:hypothetical protein